MECSVLNVQFSMIQTLISNFGYKWNPFCNYIIESHWTIECETNSITVLRYMFGSLYMYIHVHLGHLVSFVEYIWHYPCLLVYTFIFQYLSTQLNIFYQTNTMAQEICQKQVTLSFKRLTGLFSKITFYVKLNIMAKRYALAAGLYSCGLALEVGPVCV